MNVVYSLDDPSVIIQETEIINTQSTVSVPNKMRLNHW